MNKSSLCEPTVENNAFGAALSCSAWDKVSGLVLLLLFHQCPFSYIFNQ